MNWFTGHLVFIPSPHITQQHPIEEFDVDYCDCFQAPTGFKLIILMFQDAGTIWQWFFATVDEDDDKLSTW